MDRDLVPFAAPDLSQFARALGRALHERHTLQPDPPGHVELLNLLARAAGHRNVQSLRAATLRPLPRSRHAEDPVTPMPLSDRARKALQHFDAEGRLVRWPNKFSVQRLVLWPLWMQFDARRAYREAEVNAVLKAWHHFGDHAILRRELVNHRLLTRKSDCSEYRRLPARPDTETRWFLHAWRAMGPTPSPQ
jgi:hypothetical protein